MSLTPCDPFWQCFGASLRKDILYVKMPLSRAQRLLDSMELASFLTGDVTEVKPVDELLAFLREQFQAATNQSLFYRIPAEEARKDIANLITLEPRDRSGIIQKFRFSLEKGLRDDPKVDWITRMGGPKPDSRLTSSGTLAPLFLDDDLFIP